MKSTLFDVASENDTVVVRATTDLREFQSERLLDEAGPALEAFEQSTNLRNVVLDFSASDYFGSTALGLFMKLWKIVQSRGGRMALCGLSQHEREILQVTKLDSLWAVYDSCEEALKATQ